MHTSHSSQLGRPSVFRLVDTAELLKYSGPMPMASDFQTRATKYSEKYSAIYRMATEFSNLLPYGK